MLNTLIVYLPSRVNNKFNKTISVKYCQRSGETKTATYELNS